MTTYGTHLVFLHTRQDYWRELGHCSNLGSKVMFPFHEDRQIKIADTVCRGCPVQFQCLELALYSLDPNGIWGGTTEAERTPLIAFCEKLISAWEREELQEAEVTEAITSVVEAFISVYNTEKMDANDK